MAQKFNTPISIVHKKALKTPVGDSLTVPDMSYTVRDLINNFTRMPPIQKQAVYIDQEFLELESYRGKQLDMDLTDISDIKQQVARLKYRLQQAEAKANKKQEATPIPKVSEPASEQVGEADEKTTL